MVALSGCHEPVKLEQRESHRNSHRELWLISDSVVVQPDRSGASIQSSSDGGDHRRRPALAQSTLFICGRDELASPRMQMKASPT